MNPVLRGGDDPRPRDETLALPLLYSTVLPLL